MANRAQNDYTGVEFVDERERLYFERARLGIEIADFLRSNTGRYLHGRAKLDLQECQAEALECNPDSFFGRRKLKKIQRRADCALTFMRYCADVINDGISAEQELSDYRG